MVGTRPGTEKRKEKGKSKGEKKKKKQEEEKAKKAFCNVNSYVESHYVTSLSRKNQTDVPVQLRNRCESAMRGLGYGSRIERSVTSFRLT